jgi:signal transduction histidine kinase
LREADAPSKIEPVKIEPSSLAGVLLSRKRLIGAMVLAVALIAALAYWDTKRESEAALDDFAAEQATLATSIGADLAARLAHARATGAEPAAPPARLFDGIDGVEQPHRVRLLVAPPGGGPLRGIDGAVVDAPEIQRAVAEGRSRLWLSRSEAAALGLPARRAACGISLVPDGSAGKWAAIVVSSAERVRDRELRALGRMVLGVTLAAALVLLFGSVALREQRRELVLERQLAVADLQRARDRQLMTSSRTATMGTLALGIAHELSTPLGIVAGRAEQLVLRTSGDDRAARCVQAILEQTARIEKVVRGFLDLARGGKPELYRVSPERIVEGAVDLVKHRFDRAGVAVLVSLAPHLPLVRCDVAMLEQALVNLLLNACDACGGSGHVRIGAAVERERVVLTVTDDGVGITEEAAARATEPFFTTKPAARGSGLGLAIVNEIVKLHHGALTIGPAAPKGTRAAVHLPIWSPGPQPEARPDEAGAAPRTEGSSPEAARGASPIPSPAEPDGARA